MRLLQVSAGISQCPPAIGDGIPILLALTEGLFTGKFRDFSVQFLLSGIQIRLRCSVPGFFCFVLLPPAGKGFRVGDPPPRIQRRVAAEQSGNFCVKAADFHNQEYLRGEEESQVIEYDVGYNQTIRVNTTAREAFTHDLDRDIDDLQIMMAQLTEITGTLDELTKVKEGMSETDPDYELITNQVDAAQKAYDYIREGVHELFETTITRMQTHLDDTNIAVTDNGTRSSRLELVSNRLMEQKTTFQTLQSENEDVDITETAIQLTSTELTYEAALMATGKIMQTSLMNYI